jgi:cobalt-zinc-cadmium efflux system membrane fusion protein
MLAPIGAIARVGFLLLLSWCAVAPIAVAHDDDDGGGPATVASAWPRVTAQSELYEVVGILKAGRLTVFLDELATNEPVVDAALALTIGDAAPVTAEPTAGGTYVVSSPRLTGSGPVNILFSVSATIGSDRLMGTLQLPEQGMPATASPSTATSPWARLTGWLTVSIQNLLLLSLVSFLLGILSGHFFRSRQLVPAFLTSAGAAAVFVVLIGAALGHGQDGRVDSAPVGTAMSDAPRRLPDGDIWLAKPTQRLLDVRTITARPETTQRAVNLIGRVIADPNRTGLVQSISGGRVIAPEAGLPHIGQTVAKGQVLAEIERALPQADRTTISEKAGEIEQLFAVTEAKLKRLRQLAERGVALQSLVIEAEIELEGLRRRRDSIRETRLEPEVLRAPTSGVIALAKVVPGQVVHAKDIMFQIVDPKGFWVEALVYGEVAPASLADAAVVGPDGKSTKLVFRGFSRALQQQAAVVHFAIPDVPDDFNIGQPVTVIAKTGAATPGIVVPRDAIARSSNGETIVLEHHEPENFVAVPVRTLPLDATRVIVAAGVKEGERIVIRGADLVNQIR